MKRSRGRDRLPSLTTFVHGPPTSLVRDTNGSPPPLPRPPTSKGGVFATSAGSGISAAVDIPPLRQHREARRDSGSRVILIWSTVCSPFKRSGRTTKRPLQGIPGWRRSRDESGDRPSEGCIRDTLQRECESSCDPSSSSASHLQPVLVSPQHRQRGRLVVCFSSITSRISGACHAFAHLAVALC